MGGRGGSYEHYSDSQDAYSFFSVGRGKGAYPDWDKAITADERTHTIAYTGSGFVDINRVLRDDDKGYKSARKYFRIKIDNIDSAIAKFKLTKNLTVYRGAGAKLVGGYTTAAEINANMKGKIVQDKGFMSTSAVHGSQFPGTMQYEIQVPKGTGRGAFVAPISVYKSENEFLLKRGTYFEVKGAKTDSKGKTVVQLKVVDHRK